MNNIPNKFLIAFSSFLVVLVAVAVFFLIPTEKDVEKLAQLKLMLENESATMTGIQQEREGVRKEMISGKSPHRLQTRVTAEKSIVDIEKKEDYYDLKETLSGVTYVTEESVRPNHLLRVIHANQALYHHHEEQITADQVTFYRYQIEGEGIPATFEGLSPLMQGSGDQLTVDLKGEKSYRLSRARGQIFQVP